MFGDYAADCARMNFDSNFGPAIKHLRWATGDSWRVQRGVKSGFDACKMRGVYKAIVDSADFLGADFSTADAYILRAVIDNMAKTGNSTTWRQLNTTHHITQVVTDISQVRGHKIAGRRALETTLQLSFLTDE